MLLPFTQHHPPPPPTPWSPLPWCFAFTSFACCLPYSARGKSSTQRTDNRNLSLRWLWWCRLGSVVGDNDGGDAPKTHIQIPHWGWHARGGGRAVCLAVRINKMRDNSRVIFNFLPTAPADGGAQITHTLTHKHSRSTGSANKVGNGKRKKLWAEAQKKYATVQCAKIKANDEGFFWCLLPTVSSRHTVFHFLSGFEEH